MHVMVWCRVRASGAKHTMRETMNAALGRSRARTPSSLHLTLTTPSMQVHAPLPPPQPPFVSLPSIPMLTLPDSLSCLVLSCADSLDPSQEGVPKRSRSAAKMHEKSSLTDEEAIAIMSGQPPEPIVSLELCCSYWYVTVLTCHPM